MNLGRRAVWITVQFIKYQACVHLFAEYLYDFRSTSGPSMLPTFAFQDDWVIISKRYGRGRGIKVGDIVSFWIPIRPGVAGIKRVIGMPGDFVLMNTPGSGSDQMIQVPEGHCWLVGDNLGWSRDSRLYGPVPLALIKGKVLRKFSLSDWVDYWGTSLDNGLRKPEGDI